MRTVTTLPIAAVLVLGALALPAEAQQANRRTVVSIVGDQFHVDGAPIFAGRTWSTSDGATYRVEGLLMNARLVQGIFDDLNPGTRGQWMYPDRRTWDPDRNTQEFIDAMAAWREHGLVSFTINLQGGCPYGYCRTQPWVNTAFDSEGSLRPDFMNRLKRVLDRADELGMVPILGYFYFGQDERVVDEAGVIRAVEHATRWVLEQGYRNVIVEINNECSVGAYDHDILKCDRVHELIERARAIEHEGRRLYVSTSLAGNQVPGPNIVAASDYVLLHGNGVRDPNRMEEMIRQVRAMDVYRGVPIVNNEDDRPWRDDHQGFGETGNNFVVSVKNRAGWGYFDFRTAEEHGQYNLGFQSVPVNWHITSDRKRQFFDLLAQITGSPGTPTIDLDWSRQVGGATLRIEGERAEAPLRRVELLINNQTVATSTARPFDFQVDVPAGEHWVRARAVYTSNGRDVIIETPHYQNPWWPYGGPAPVK